MYNQRKLEENVKKYNERKKETVYIAGAITDDPEYKTKFRKAQKKLQKAGFKVFNPATFPEGLEYEAYIRISRAILREVDNIYMLKGWEDSVGAVIEFEYATSLGKGVFMETK